MTENLKIGIITGKKSTDALICKTLSENFPSSKIFQYQIPIKMWFPWIWRRVTGMGIIVLIGHLALSIYLRVERKVESFRGKSLWLQYMRTTPSWNGLKDKKEFCFSEESLIEKINGNDVVIITDSFRLSHKFFRQVKAPCLQLIWGIAPNYLGDSAGFWAFANSDTSEVGISMVKRYAQFNKLEILAVKSIKCDEKENLRTIKIKQTMAMSEILPETIKEFVHNKNDKEKITETKICRIFQAPTLWDYLHFLKFGTIKTLPHYSRINNPCILTTFK